MDLHPNWIALATVDFERKIFVRERTEDRIESPKKNEFQQFNSLSGEEAKNFYLDVVSASSGAIVPIENSTVERENQTKTIEIIERDVNERTRNRFLLAAQENDAETLKKLLDRYPILLNMTDDYGWTALMCAVQSLSIEAIKFLVSREADTNLTDKLGRSALSLASNNIFLLQLINCRNLEKSNENKTQRLSNRFFCETCQQDFKGDRKKHKTSTLHVFNSNKNFKMKTYYGIPESNRGYQIMLRRGWDKEVGLGPSGCGSKYPVKTIHKLDRHGIGIETDVPRVTHKPNMESKYERLKRQNKIEKEYKRNIATREKNIEINLRRELS